MGCNYIEDEVLQSEKFQQLVKEVGSVDWAIGSLWRAWRLAEEYFPRSVNRGVPKQDWIDHEIEPGILRFGFAVELGGQIVMVGAMEKFDHLVNRRSVRKISKTVKQSEPAKGDVMDHIQKIWDAYPNKQGKAVGVEKLVQFSQENSLGPVAKGLANQLLHWKREGTEAKYIPMFSTWVNQQRWLDFQEDQKPQVERKVTEWVMPRPSEMK